MILVSSMPSLPLLSEIICAIGLDSYLSATSLASWGWLLPVNSLIEFDAMIGVVFVVDYMVILFERKFWGEEILTEVCVIGGVVPRLPSQTRYDRVNKILYKDSCNDRGIITGTL